MMKIRESELRRVIREELTREGFADRVLSLFGGGDKESRGGGGISGLAGALPTTPAMRAFGITPKDVAGWAEGGRIGEDVKSRTSPAEFRFGSFSSPDRVSFRHPLARAGDVKDAGLERFFAETDAARVVRPLIPEDKRSIYRNGMQAEEDVPRVSPSMIDGGRREAETITRLGVDQDKWKLLTRMQTDEGRVVTLKELTRAMTLIKLIGRAHRMAVACWGDELASRMFSRAG